MILVDLTRLRKSQNRTLEILVRRYDGSALGICGNLITRRKIYSIHVTQSLKDLKRM